jgi:chemotaxis protein CheD
MPLLQTKKWVIPQPKKSLIAGVADMVVSSDPGADLVTYSLGSCLGVVLYDPLKKIGGLLHVMLPDSSIHPAKAADWPSMFMDTGVPRLFHSLYHLGADRSRLIVKAAGGAQFLDTAKVFNIGARNQQALLALLDRNGFALQAGDFGGVSSRTLRLDLGTGKVQIQTPGIEPYLL